MSKLVWTMATGLIISVSAVTQTAPDKYWVEFTDKKNTSFSIDQPLEFLSPRAVERRINQSIQITEQDLPVNSFYTDSLKKLGLDVLYTSRWFNAATVYSQDTLLMDTLHNYGFVKNPVRTFSIEPAPVKTDTVVKKVKKKKKTSFLLNYDMHLLQLEIMNGHKLHNIGYRGKGMMIAVLDAGFYRTNVLPAFDSVWARNCIISTRNFVNDTADVFKTHTHGMKVLSIMAGNMPGYLMGSAPEADYVLIQSEDSQSEYAIEGDNWIAAAEFADSIGADVINSSLGYSTFDAPEQNYAYSDMDGNTSRITQAADIAASKGILVVTSAGNQGNKSWKYITAPADADSALTVGAVTPTGEYAAFSSKGPAYDGRIKPNVSAIGLGTFYQQTDSTIAIGNGTSFSSPLVAGLAACLWQHFPQANNMEILKTIEASANLYPFSDTLTGYGIPDFYRAWILLQARYGKPADIDRKKIVNAFPNPFSTLLYLEINSQQAPDSTKVNMNVFNLSSQKLLNQTVTLQPGYNLITIDELMHVSPGEYLIRLKGNGINEKITVIKY
ncbi:MAG: S8 family serine peptidase [Bacteroidetes bacterium]|jgi:subtilisin family serine protease|nr:S8 family serine peptidase [Bacteroidota bacterium]